MLVAQGEVHDSQSRRENSSSPSVLAPHVQQPAPVSKTPTVASGTKPGASDSASVLTANDGEISAENMELRSIVKLMLSRELFKLQPTNAQAYFADIAVLHPQPSDEAWLKRFEGRSKLPWMENVIVELQEEGERWQLGQSQLTWRPPRHQALALYERLVQEVQKVRGRKPNFARDESEGMKLQRQVGWNWCKEACEAIVALDSDGHSSSAKSSQIDENHPALTFTVYIPEGP